MPRVYTEVFERLSLKPCVASVKEDFFYFFFFHSNCNHWSRAAVQLPRPKQTRGCAPLPPITKALTAHIPDPDLSSSPTFLIKNHSWFGLLSFFSSPSLSSFLLSSLLLGRTAAFCSFHPFVTMQSIMSRFICYFTSESPERFSLHCLYVVRKSPYVKRCHYSCKWKGLPAVISAVTLG